MNLQGKTFAFQSSLPKLPIPTLEETCKRYLRALEGLQDPSEHERTKAAVDQFLSGEGPRLQEKLKAYAGDKASYIEEFWYESYLSHSDPVVLALNPFFLLEDDPTPTRGSQLPRAARLISSSLSFVHDVRAGVLDPDSVRGQPLDMHQYTQLFGTARIPTARGCRMAINHDSKHVVVLRRGQFYYFDVLDSKNRPVLTEREIMRNLEAIVADADKTPDLEVAKDALAVLSTESRKYWSHLRTQIASESEDNASCLQIVDDALFVVCLDVASPETTGDICANFLCGTYELKDGAQVGSCTNRWYDKLQIIVTGNGTAGINFEHTGVDGHTVLRYAADVFTEGLMAMARSINPAAPTLFKAKLSPHAASYRRKPNEPVEPSEHIDTSPKKLEWRLTSEIRTAIRFAETRLSDLICQNECEVLEFKHFGKNFITRHGFSPDAFVQMAFQAGYYGLYGQIECTYEPAMTKAFFHGRTEAIRTVQPESVAFTKAFYSDQAPQDKVNALRKACENHVRITKECGKGFGQDRHLYALYCLLQREIHDTDSGRSSPSNGESPDPPTSPTTAKPQKKELPSIFTDSGYSLLGTSILSTSNCGNPALRLFGFAPVAADGFGIGYIIKDDAISIAATSKHLQTKRFLATIQTYLLDVQKMLIALVKAANERSDAFVDHSGALRDVRTGTVLVPPADSTDAQDDEAGDDDAITGGYSFFDSGEVESFIAKRKRQRHRVGRILQISEY